MLNRRHVADRGIFHVKVVLADEDHRQLPYRREVQSLVEGADIGGAVAEEADRHVAVALVLRAQRRSAGDRQMRADDGIGAEHAVFGGGEMHGAALAAHEAVVALHQLAQHLLEKFKASWKAPILVVPSPKKQTVTSPSPLYCARNAAPQAIGKCAPMMA